MRVVFFAALFFFQTLFAYADSLRIGTTYSPKQSEYLGLDWRETYLAILNVGFDLIRLGTYWSEIEKKEDVYDFTVLDWQIFEAKRKGVPIILTVGMKAPRWPEYFIPQWVFKHIYPGFGDEISDEEYLRERTLQFIRTVVSHYKKETIVQYWQIENEPLDREGQNYWWIGHDFLKQEADLVREMDDKKRPIIINIATYPNKFLRSLARFFTPRNPINDSLALCDILGLDVYPAVGHKFWWRKFYFWSTKQERAEYFSDILNLAKSRKKKVWIIEFQAEPWEPGVLVYKEKNRPPTGWPEMTKVSFQELRELGFDTILLWGAEYWHFRETQHKDKNWWEMVLDLFNARKEILVKEVKKKVEKVYSTRP